MRRVGFPIQVAILFSSALAGGLALQLIGVLPGNPRAAAERWAATFLATPRVGPTPSAAVPDLHDPVVTRGAISPRPMDPMFQIVPLVGDSDPTRNALRRAVVITARAALGAPCDLDKRAAFQMSLRDYARAFASGPRSVGERADFRTPLDGEAARATGAALKAGLLDPDLVQRWRALERTGVDEILRRERLSLSSAAADACPGGERRA